MRKHTVLKWVMLPIVVLAAMFALEALCQLPLLRLDAQNAGLHTLDSMTFSLVDAESGEALYDSFEDTAEDEDTESYADAEFAAALFTVSDDSQALYIPYTGFVHELTLEGSVATSQRYTVRCTLADGSETQVTSVFLDSLSEDSVLIDREVTALSVTFPMGVTIEGAQVHNEVVLNWNRMLLFGLVSACAYLLIAFRKAMGKRQELAFLCVALCMGLFLSIALPVNVTICFDDEVHSVRAFLLSTWPKAEVPHAATLMGALSWSMNENNLVTHRLDTLRDENALIRQMDEAALAEDATPEEITWSFSDTSYVVMAAGIRLARALGLPMHLQFIAARMANMLLYVIVCFFAVKALRRFKMVMACATLMPSAMYQACSVTYDATGTALCYLGIALAVDAMLDRETPLSWQRALGILLCFVVGSMTKIVYIPLLLLVLLLPRRKFASGGQRTAFKLLAMVCMAGVVLAMVFNVAGGNIALQDNRGPGADSSAQIAFILHHPLTYLGYFFSTIFHSFGDYFLTNSRTLWGYIGSCSGTLNWLSLGLMFFTVFTDHDPELKQRLNWKLRLAMLIIAGMVVGMVFTTMYVAFSPVGTNDFSGVQARYLLPVMPLLMMLLSPEGVHNRMKKDGWTMCFGLLNLIVLAGTAWQLVCVQFFG